jgi:hypothetical protein
MIRQKDLVELTTQQPFHPFRIHLSDGTSHDVSHPELLKVGPHTALLFTPKARYNFVAFDNVHTISILHISRLETVGAPAKARKHG